MVTEFAREIAAGIVANAIARDRRARAQAGIETTPFPVEAAELYLSPAAADAPVWDKRVFRNRPIGPYLVTDQPAILGGILVVRGAGDVQVLAYNQNKTEGTLQDENLIAPASAISTALNTDGFVNFPIEADKGIVVNISQADALVIVYFVQKTVP